MKKLIISSILVATLITGGVVAMQDEPMVEPTQPSQSIEEPIAPQPEPQQEEAPAPPPVVQEPTNEPDPVIITCPDEITFYQNRLETLRTAWYEPTIESIRQRTENLSDEQLEAMAIRSGGTYGNSWDVAKKELAKLQTQYPDCF